MTEIPLDESFSTAKSDEQRIALLSAKIIEQEQVVFAARFQLAHQEGILEALYRLRERLGEPMLSHKHTLRGRAIKYLTEHPETACTDLAKALCTPVTTMSMCLNRNKELFVKNADGLWSNKRIQS
jgi:hypothetical protein